MFAFLSVTNITKLERLYRATSRAVTSRPPLLFLLSEASLPSLRVTLIHFVLLSYERALRLPNFPILCLARLGVKPRLSKSFWRKFWSVHRLILSPTFPRVFLFAFSLFTSWNLLSLTVELTPFSPCSRSDLLFLAQVRLLLTLTFYHLTIW